MPPFLIPLVGCTGIVNICVQRSNRCKGANLNNLKTTIMKTIEINGHKVTIEGLHSRISFFAISKAVGIEGKGLIPFIFDGVTYKSSYS